MKKVKKLFWWIIAFLAAGASFYFAQYSSLEIVQSNQELWQLLSKILN